MEYNLDLLASVALYSFNIDKLLTTIINYDNKMLRDDFIKSFFTILNKTFKCVKKKNNKIIISFKNPKRKKIQKLN